MEEIEVTNLLLLPVPKLNFKLNREEILKRQAFDLGELMQNIPGISLKNYGGLGGMKTISARGINGSHSGIILDGFLLQNSQTAQIDLSTIQVDNLKEMNFSFNNSTEILDLVSFYFNANNLRLTSFENQFSLDTFQLKCNLKIGSFEQIDSYLSAKWNHRKVYFSVFGKYRQAKGNFPFSVENYKEILSLERTNNQLQEFYSGINFGYFINPKNKIKFNFLSSFSDKGLPGAVILYNPTSNQYLTNKNFSLNSDYNFLHRKTRGRIYLSQKYDELTYLDSGYLNTQGFLKSEYFNTSISLGTILRKNFSNGLQISSGVEENYAFLQNSTNFSTGIQRFHSKAILDFHFLKNNWNYDLNFGFQHIYNQQINQTNTYQKFNFSPSLSIYSQVPIYFLGELKFSARRSLRMPSFNELYYNQIGNVNLKPEIANQLNLGTFYNFNVKNNVIKFTFDAYANLVENKIVAIPTKNLFIWSIQNVGTARILGFDFQFSHEKSFNKTWTFQNSINYTFQDITDISDKNSETFGDQLAYLPKHILSANFSIQYKNVGLNLNAYFNSLRYALNENIKSNEVKAFYFFDLTTYFTPKIKKSSFRYSFSAKNILNQSYSYIRSYAMPGRNYLLSVSYAFN
ncbi:MAG: TonB-dependent receptor plug domain-containing protein [Bacteroidota bacterium]